MKKLPDGIKEIRFKGRVPSIAYTDFSAIYISHSLTGEDLFVARKHEKAHIWLQHQKRMENIGKNIDRYLFNIAGDMEIALHIYDSNDEKVISNIHSLIHKGITKNDCIRYPNCQYAEEFYEELLKEKKEILDKLRSIDAKFNKNRKVKNGSLVKENIKSIVKQAINNARKESEQHQKRKSITEAQYAINKFKPQKPTLASVIDSCFGRNKIERVSSYRRPNRRESDFLQKGEISKRKQPNMAIFVDRSGSFDSMKTSKATNILMGVIKKYRGKIKNDSFYFNDKLMQVDPCTGNGGTNYQCVIDFLKENPSELAIIITDDDQTNNMKFFNYSGKTIIIPIGCNNTWIGSQLKANGFNVIEINS